MAEDQQQSGENIAIDIHEINEATPVIQVETPQSRTGHRRMSAEHMRKIHHRHRRERFLFKLDMILLMIVCICGAGVIFALQSLQ
ncbi:hypothetical protein KIH75_06600 [Bifidobacterium sp. 64T4]|uniref:hypothetical protein n=1 Tax=Bifidobacterium pongonis TaxID=2834432 RepID=UPI001C561E37|nr:hypothetical protein [Bifidobacterium pongonis]MBW3095006.1 hypothetical protein [Bifidobacterium pongonis]